MTRLTRLKVFLVATLVGLLAASAQAAVISVEPVVVRYYDTALNPLTIPPPPPYSSIPMVVQIDVIMRVLSLAPGEDSFGSAVFSFDFDDCCGGGVLDSDAGGWAPNIFNVDSNGAPPGGIVPLFATNGDLGVDSMDLQGIVVQIATGAFTNAVDPRRNIGEPGSPLGVPFRLGSAFLDWSILSPVFITLNTVQVSAKAANGQFIIAEAVSDRRVVVGEWLLPEPSSLFLMGSCLMGVVLHRRVG